MIGTTRLGKRWVTGSPATEWISMQSPDKWPRLQAPDHLELFVPSAFERLESHDF